MFVNEPQLTNGVSPIFKTLAGIFTEVIAEHFENAPCAIFVTVFGIEYSDAVDPAGYASRVDLSLVNKTPFLMNRTVYPKLKTF